MTENQNELECPQIEGTTPETKNKKPTKKMNADKKIIEASVLGTIAFKDGKKCVPCLDKNLIGLLAGCKKGESLPIMKAWEASWHSANLALA